MPDMLPNFKKYILDQKLFNPQDAILVAVSGGIDSVVLADLFYQSGYSFGIAHCNFNLRGEESDMDEVFVRELARKYQIPFYSQSFDTPKEAQKRGISTQMAARQLRYDWFAELLRKEAFNFIATAHHLNDLLETALLNLTRGTGIAGLHGIPVKNGNIIRPLLFATRNEIEQYAQSQQITWREDSSNQEDKYTRNLIRHKVIPVLKSINPKLEKTWAHSADKIQSVENIFLAQNQAFFQQITERKGEMLYIYFNKLKNITEPVIQLYQYLEVYGFAYSQCQSMIASLDNISGLLFESDAFQIVKDREAFILSPKTSAELVTYEIVSGQTSLETSKFTFYIRSIPYDSNYEIVKKANWACVDLQKLKFPLLLRPWQLGDWFYPLGMKHRKKLSDFFIDLKIPRNVKQESYVLCSQDDIVWVVGYRIDDRFKIQDHTKEVLEIQKSP